MPEILNDTIGPQKQFHEFLSRPSYLLALGKRKHLCSLSI